MLTIALLATVGWAEPTAGERIYKAQCVQCHGANGEGTAKANLRLEGDYSAAQLGELIQTTMPEDKPGSLSQADADAVAKYVYDNFYSAIAKERNRPARIALARLTVNQHRNALTDLLGNDDRRANTDDKQGLKGEYYSSRSFRQRDRTVERVDPNVDFNFKKESPAPGKMEPHEFSIRWSGSVYAPRTGEYLFMIRTENAARLWVNSNDPPLIDRWVKSGKDTEFSATIYLLGGREYPIRLEFSKAKQGVNDNKDKKKKPPSLPASIHLLWQPPKSVLEPIPARLLKPGSSRPSYVCPVAFPPDDRSYGWERGVAISKEWDEAISDAAIHAANYSAERMQQLVGVRPEDKDAKDRIKRYCVNFGERAFRRPLAKGEVERMVDKPLAEAKDLQLAFKKIVIRILVSPHFLYREVDANPDQFDVAARLSFALWDSIPDKKLREAAAKGQLKTRAQVAQQASQMLADPRAKAKLQRFLVNWAGAEHDRELAKDQKLFAGFDSHLIGDFRTSLELMLNEVFWSEKSDLRDLLTTPEVYVNQRMAKFFGIKTEEKSGFAKVSLDAGKRSGVLTHPYVMTTFSHAAESSPIHRGVFLARGVLGVSLRPPPEAVAPLSPDLHPSLTTRERVELQTKPAACTSCHALINPLGFTLENFDAVGRFRTEEHGRKIDATGSYRTRSGAEAKVNGPKELAAFLTKTDETYDAFVEQMFHHLAQQPLRAYGEDVRKQLREQLKSNKLNMRQLAVEIATETAMKPREAEKKVAAKSAEEKQQ